MKKIIILSLLFVSFNATAQEKAPNQKELLAQYIGNWASADNIADTIIGLNPNIKMTVLPKMNGQSLQVEVFQKQGTEYVLILVELISYDVVTNQIVAAGQNKDGQCFIGKGYFMTKNQWFMRDANFKGEPTLHVDFNFVNTNEVVLKGVNPNDGSGWHVKYIRENKN
jgi:hypothetical protein